jgi:hypothetical protein
MPPVTTTDASAATSGIALLRRLVDDAAVFPPGNASLADAVRQHAVHRSAWYADCVGPLLVPAAASADLVQVLDTQDGGGAPGAEHPLEIVLVARPGAHPGTTTAALEALSREYRVRVVGAELAWHEGWRDLGLESLPVALEVPRGEDSAVAVADVHTARSAGRPVVAKFRTGPTATWAWPDEAELAGFIGLCARLGVPFKLTGGLHHAVRGRYSVDGIPEENHGVLDVLVATSAALAGASPAELAALLAVRDATALADLVAAWPDGTAAGVRAAFTAYGCCTVTDPVGDLPDLGLLHRPGPAPPAPDRRSTDRPTEGPP